jgi:hypothetical protein
MRKVLCIMLLLSGCSSGPKPLPEPDGTEFKLNLQERTESLEPHNTTNNLTRYPDQIPRERQANEGAPPTPKRGWIW